MGSGFLNRFSAVSYRSIAAMVAGSLFMAACAHDGPPLSSSGDSDEMALINAERIKNDMTFLADDAMKGRDTGSAEYQIAANYMASQFAHLGLVPAGDGGGYFQNVSFAKGRLVGDSASATLTVDGEDLSLEWGKDFLIGSTTDRQERSMSGELVFVGYGISAPSIGHDDYAGIDVEGKIVVALSGAPKSFDSEVSAAFGSGNTKRKMADDKGAIGYLAVMSASLAKRFTMERMQRFYSGWDLEWQTPEGVGFSAAPGIGASALISNEIADKLFQTAGSSLEAVLNAASKGEKLESFAIDASMVMSSKNEIGERFTSPNVAAILPGSDPKLADEYVVISAHLDHIGVHESAKGDDKINNGAMDNASGTSVMLEVARAFVSSGQAPRRSVIFLSVTGEEKGLMGADFFARYPTVPQDKIVANVNLDMPILLYDFADVIAFGAEHSSLKGTVERAISKFDVILSPDPIPEQGLFTRSDHFRFVQQGIPSVFLEVGFSAVDPDVNGEELWMGFLKNNYHKPNDDMNLPISWKAAEKFALMNYLIIREIANADARPTWNEGDPFKALYAK